MRELTQEYVRELFDYKDGHLYWRVKRKRAKKGVPAGRINHKIGYIQIGVDGKYRYEHRLVFLYHHGYLPNNLDHINGIKTDNRIENIRPATPGQNLRNRGKFKNNKSSHKNVFFNKNTNKWRVSVVLNYKSHYFGEYSSLEQAAEVARKAREKLHKEFCNHN